MHDCTVRKNKGINRAGILQAGIVVVQDPWQKILDPFAAVKTEKNFIGSFSFVSGAGQGYHHNIP